MLWVYRRYARYGAGGARRYIVCHSLFPLMPIPTLAEMRETVEILQETKTVDRDSYEQSSVFVVKMTPPEFPPVVVEWRLPAKVVIRTPSVALQENFSGAGADVEGYYVWIKNPRAQKYCLNPAFDSDMPSSVDNPKYLPVSGELDEISTNDKLKWRGRTYRIAGIAYRFNDDWIFLTIMKQDG